MAPAAKKKLITEVDTKLYNAMKRRAKEEDRSIAAMIRHAMRVYLESSGIDVGRSDR